MEWIVTAILGLFIFFCLYWFTKSRENYWKERGVPCAVSSSIFGSVFSMLFRKRSFGDIILETYNKLDGHPFGGFLQFVSPVLMLRDPELITQIIVKDFSYFEDRGFSVDEDVEPLNANLANSTGDRWRNLRHKLTPTFTSGKLKGMFEQIVSCTDNILEYTKEKGEPFEARTLMQKCNLNIIGTVAFGLDMNACKEDDATEKFLTLSGRFAQPNVFTLLKLILKQIFPKLFDYLRLRIMDNEVTEFFTKLVKDTVKIREESGNRRNDFLQMMIDLRDKDRDGNLARQADSKNEREELEPEDKELISHLKYVVQSDSSKKYRFTDNTILGQSFLFISGGSETTATALSFALYQLAANGHIQRRLQDEIDSVLANQEFTYLAVKEMTYLDYFIDEVLRLNPPGPFLVRQCNKPYRIPHTDIIIEKGVLLNVPVMAIHKDPRFFPDPEKFDPERFREKNYPKGAYLPFGDGPRSCIANRLALLEMKVIISRLLMKYSIVMSEKTQLPLKMDKKSQFLQHAEGGIWVELRER